MCVCIITFSIFSLTPSAAGCNLLQHPLRRRGVCSVLSPPRRRLLRSDQYLPVYRVCTSSVVMGGCKVRLRRHHPQVFPAGVFVSLHQKQRRLSSCSCGRIGGAFDRRDHCLIGTRSGPLSMRPIGVESRYACLFGFGWKVIQHEPNVSPA